MDEAAEDVRRAQALLALHERLGEAESDLEGLLHLAVQQVSELLGNAAGVWVLDGGSLSLRAFVHDDLVKQAFMREVTEGLRHRIDGPVGTILEHRDPVWLTAADVAAGQDYLEPAHREYFQRYPVEGLLIAPLHSRGQPVGLLGVGRDPGSKPFAERDQAFLVQVARVVALTLANAVLFDELGEARRRTEALLREDDVTGLLNRRGFLEAMRGRLEDRDHGSFLVAVMDVDGFKMVNDGFGSAAGDMVLSSLAARLCAALPAVTPVARIGADEFAVLIESPDDEESAAILEQAVVECSGTLAVVGLSVPLTVSVGTVVPRAESADEVLLQANLAMYRAKRRGAMVAAYDARLDDPATRRLRDVMSLRRVISRGELVVHYQPVVPVRGGQLRLEALVRREVEGRLLPPGGWLHIAVRAGLMAELTDSVMAKVVDQLVAWRSMGFDVEVAVNVPAPVLADPEVVSSLVDRLDRAGLPRRSLSVEVTEGDLVGPQAKAALKRCQEAHISVAVDDFGTGWSALSYLVDLPLQTLKIDRSFVDGCDVDVRRASIVRAVVDIAHELGLRVVAEGVETRNVADVIIDLGADALQGYLYARPSSADDLEDLLRSGMVATHS